MLEKRRKKHLTIGKNAQNRAEHIVQIVNTTLENNEDSVKNAIKSHVEVAYDIVLHIYNKYYNNVSDDDLKALIVDALRKLRFFIGDSYIYINDFSGNVILHPTLEHIEGQNVLNAKDLELKSLFEKEISFIINNEEGLIKRKHFSIVPGKPKEEYYVYVKRISSLNIYLATAVPTKYIKNIQ